MPQHYDDKPLVVLKTEKQSRIYFRQVRRICREAERTIDNTVASVLRKSLAKIEQGVINDNRRKSDCSLS